MNDPTPGALDAQPFKINVEDPEYSESWADEVEVYHNPNARIPLNPDLLPSVTHFFLKDGEPVWTGPAPRVLFSQTQTLFFDLEATIDGAVAPQSEDGEA